MSPFSDDDSEDDLCVNTLVLQGLDEGRQEVLSVGSGRRRDGGSVMGELMQDVGAGKLLGYGDILDVLSHCLFDRPVSSDISL